MQIQGAPPSLTRVLIDSMPLPVSVITTIVLSFLGADRDLALHLAHRAMAMHHLQHASPKVDFAALLRRVLDHYTRTGFTRLGLRAAKRGDQFLIWVEFVDHFGTGQRLLDGWSAKLQGPMRRMATPFTKATPFSLPPVWWQRRVDSRLRGIPCKPTRQFAWFSEGKARVFEWVLEQTLTWVEMPAGWWPSRLNCSTCKRVNRDRKKWTNLLENPPNELGSL